MHGAINEEEFTKFIKANYKSIYKGDSSYHSELAGHCDFCKRDAYLKIKIRWQDKGIYREDYLPNFATMFIQCPSCERKSFLQTVVLSTLENSEGGGSKWVYEYYKLYLLPTTEHKYEIKDIPSEHTSLKQTITEAIYCLDGSQYISAAIMFRRGLQILAKDVLGATGKDLYNQLEWLKTNPNKLGVSLTNMFHDNSELLRKVGNQGAHPDNDPTLHNFTEDDANGLHDLFLVIINEVFVLPAKMKALQDELKTRRKIK
jgi:hypothetical protein